MTSAAAETMVYSTYSNVHPRQRSAFMFLIPILHGTAQPHETIEVAVQQTSPYRSKGVSRISIRRSADWSANTQLTFIPSLPPVATWGIATR